MMVPPPPIIQQWSGFAAPETPVPTSVNGSMPALTPASAAGAAATGIYSFKKVLATQWYLDCMANNGTPLTNLKSQDVSRGNLAFSFFKAMSTKEEVQILLARPRDEAAAVRTVREVEKWVRKRIEAAYRQGEEAYRQQVAQVSAHGQLAGGEAQVRHHHHGLGRIPGIPRGGTHPKCIAFSKTGGGGGLRPYLSIQVPPLRKRPDYTI